MRHPALGFRNSDAIFARVHTDSPLTRTDSRLARTDSRLARIPVGAPTLTTVRTVRTSTYKSRTGLDSSHESAQTQQEAYLEEGHKATARYV